MTPEKVKQIFARFAKQTAAPTTELHYDSVFELLIAVMLSAQATDVSVNQATQTLFKIANTPETILQLGETKLKKYIQTIGLYNTKAKNIIKTCEILIQHYHSQVPNQRALLEALPGVGRKTANVILNTAFGETTIAVDTHVFRVAHRLGLATGKTPLLVENELMKMIPATYLQHAHHWLILHGRYTCTARKPHCAQCVISDLCEFKDKTHVH